MKFDRDIHGLWRVNPNYFSGALTFQVAQSADQTLSRKNKFVKTFMIRIWLILMALMIA